MLYFKKGPLKDSDYVLELVSKGSVADENRLITSARLAYRVPFGGLYYADLERFKERSLQVATGCEVADGRKSEPAAYRFCEAASGMKFFELAADDVPNHVAGAYRGASDVLTGFTLYLFPDRKAVIAEWGDLQSIARPVAEGFWKVGDDGSVAIDWTYRQFRDLGSRWAFESRYGRCAQMRAFICFGSAVTGDSVALVSEEYIGEKIENAYWQFARFIDWKEIRESLERAKNTLAKPEQK